MVEHEEKEGEKEDKGIRELIEQLMAMADQLGEIELENVIIETDALEFEILPGSMVPMVQPSAQAAAVAKAVPEVLVLPTELLSATFIPPITEWPG
ncbi:MAG: hypothetical protein Q6356_010225, partial [Candidatus Wukongarchaeota archaeon]|nr:hypothetical protein [Candidatus Wukongarchaeota archaeon]